MHGIQIGAVERASSFPLGDDGMSMLEMKSTLGKFGLPVDIRSCSVRELQRNPASPVIVQMKSSMRSLGKGERGHYVLVLATTDRGVTVIDGTSGEIMEFPLSLFAAKFAGYVIETHETDLLQSFVLQSLGLAALVAVFAASYSARRFISKRWSTLAGRRTEEPLNDENASAGAR